MSQSALCWSRRVLILGCLFAIIPASWRLADALGESQDLRLAAEAHAQGVDLRNAGRFLEAVPSLQAAISYDPGAVRSYELLADTQFRLGRIDDAIRTYRQILRAYPYAYMSALYRGVGFIQLQAGRYHGAREDLSKAVSLNPDDWSAHYFLGNARAALRDLSGARAAWTRTLELNPEFQPARDKLREADAQERQ